MRLTADPDTLLVSSRVHNSPQEISQAPHKELSFNKPDVMMDVDLSGPSYETSNARQFPAANGKRKAIVLSPDEGADGLNLRRSKRIKVSVPQKNVDLDW